MIPAMSLLTRARDALTMVGYTEAVTAAYVDPTTLPYSSPWAEPCGLPAILYRDLVDTSHGGFISRGAAMRLAPIRRGRNFLVSTISRLPLVDLVLGQTVPAPADYATRADYVDALAAFHATQPTWMYRSDDGASPQHRMTWMVDDLIFRPATLLATTRSESTGLPLTMQRVNFDRWTINEDNRIEIDEVVQSDEQVILIPGLSEGILVDGVDVLRDARSLADIVRARLKNPVPLLNLQQVSGEDLNETERKAMVSGWSAARQGENSGVAFSNRHVKPEAMGGDMDSALMIEARNASAVDQARLIGVSASRLDASGVNSTLTYETTTGRNQEAMDFDLALYTLPIEARLSMDDVVPRGHRAAFDLTDFTAKAPSVTGPNRQD